MDDLLHMFEVLDTSKSGAISAKDLSKFLLLIKKMRNFDFDLEKYIENVSGTDDDPLLGQGNSEDMK